VTGVPGAFCLVLHSHLPWVAGHGVWPLGEEWLHQAVADTYAPLAAELDSLADEGHRDVLTLGVTPVLAAQLDDQRMVADTRAWAAMWEMRTREMGFADGPEHRVAEHEYGQAARVEQLLENRWRAGGSPVLRSLRDSGVIELLGGPAAHPFLPLTLPEVAAAGLAAGMHDSVWRLGERPEGIWSPECGYSPWLGEHLDRAGIGYFVIDEQTARNAGGHPHAAWRVAGRSVLAVPRDLEVTNLVWSPDGSSGSSGGSSGSGYPSAPAYRALPADFQLHEELTGLRLWAVTSAGATADGRSPYDPEAARHQVAADVAHFANAVAHRLTEASDLLGRPALTVAAYDTELFGHCWHEGPAFLGQAVRALRESGVTVTTLARALEMGLVAGELELGEGSWGPGRHFSMWNGPAVSEIAREGYWMQRRWVDLTAREAERGRLRLRRPDLDQLTSTLFNGLSSDWAFLVTRGQAAAYARRREAEHRREFHALAQLIEDGRRHAALEEAARQAQTDMTFPALDVRTLI
jgi:1,4-alpha-glucan branching enzyme